MKGERFCIVCGKKYVYCTNCKKGDPKESWRYQYDSEDCRGLFRICADFAFGHITATQAKLKLKKYNLTDLTGYSDDVKNNIAAINATADRDATVNNSNEVKKEKETAENVHHYNNNKGRFTQKFVNR